MFQGCVGAGVLVRVVICCDSGVGVVVVTVLVVGVVFVVVLVLSLLLWWCWQRVVSQGPEKRQERERVSSRLGHGDSIQRHHVWHRCFQCPSSSG